MKKRIIALVAAAALAALCAGCKQEGPAERAGKKLDNFMEKAKEKVEKATQ